MELFDKIYILFQSSFSLVVQKVFSMWFLETLQRKFVNVFCSGVRSDEDWGVFKPIEVMSEVFACFIWIGFECLKLGEKVAESGASTRN